jgi:hypothetical protein
MRCQVLAVMAILESQDFSQIDSFAEVFVLLIRRGQELLAKGSVIVFQEFLSGYESGYVANFIKGRGLAVFGQNYPANAMNCL